MATNTDTSDLFDKQLDEVKDACPAFQNGACAYANFATPKMQEMSALLKTQCPAFADGCPFKHDDDMKSVMERMSNIASAHAGQPADVVQRANASLQEFFSAMHEAGVKAKADLGECPVFSTSCPFKNVCSDGRPLIQELEYRQWSVFQEQERVQIDEVEVEDGAILLSKNFKVSSYTSPLLI
jgi:hypothetical protein